MEGDTKEKMCHVPPSPLTRRCAYARASLRLRTSKQPPVTTVIDSPETFPHTLQYTAISPYLFKSAIGVYQPPRVRPPQRQPEVPLNPSSPFTETQDPQDGIMCNVQQGVGEDKNRLSRQIVVGFWLNLSSYGMTCIGPVPDF